MYFVNAEFEHSNTNWQPMKPSEVERMYNNPFMSDIVFTFGKNKPGEVFDAHKYVLAISSPLFYEMFYSNTEQITKTINLPDHDKETLAGFFGFIYKDDCPTDLEKDFGVLKLIIKYEIVRFYNACRNSLQQNTEPERAYTFVEKFLELNAEALAEICLGMIDALADEYFASKHFLNIKQRTLNMLLKRDTLDYNETDIFKAVLKWTDHQCSLQKLEITRANRRMILGDAIYSIRFLLMNQGEFTTHVLPSDLLHDNETVAIMKAMTGEEVPNLTWDTLKLRRKRLPEWFTTTTWKKSSSWTDYLGVLVWEHLIPLIHDFIFGMGITVCVFIAIRVYVKWNKRHTCKPKRR
jgi:hypothetical protein